jgi:ribosomal 30S subunit maturation factor RimM
VPGDPTALTPPAGYVALGRLGRSFQLEGGMRLHAAGEAEGDALTSLERVFVVGHGEALVRDIRWIGGGPVLYLEGVRDRDAARLLTHAAVYGPGAAVVVARSAHPGEQRALEMVGAVVTMAGREVGTVVGVDRGGPQDLARIQTRRGEALVPLDAPYVRWTGDRLEIVDAPEGLLDPA